MTEPEAGMGPPGDPNRRLRTIAGRQVLFDGEGFMWHPEEWTEEVARALAVETGVGVPTAEHWRIMHCLRSYFLENGRAPLNRQLAKAVGLSLLQIQALFPGGIKYGARRMAGLPNPKTCM